MLRCTAAIFLLMCATTAAAAQPHVLDEMSLDRWAKLREVERYQLRAAERYYRDQDWKAALAEYEKYLSLYEPSEAAPHAQLKWGLCQMKLRKANTAIKDGFQTVIDYWPNSPDAVLAAYHIGQAYKGMGQIPQAKKAYDGLLKDHLQHPAAIHAIAELLDITQIENDYKTRVELWKKLIFETKRTEGTRQLWVKAAKNLADHYFRETAFDDAVKVLALSGPADDLPHRVAAQVLGPLGDLAAADATRPKAEKLAALAVSYLRQRIADSPAAGGKMTERQLLYAIADIYAAARQDAKVPPVYDEVARRCGASDEALGRLAEWYESKGNFEEAYKLFRRYQDKAAGICRVATGYRQRRQYDAAVAVYRELVRVDAASEKRWMEEIAATYRRAGKMKEAVGVYEQLRRADAAGANRWLAEIAATYREARRYGDAIGVYQELLKADLANVPRWLWQIATAYHDNGQYKEAIGFLRQCTNFPENYKVMADCHRKLRQYNEALVLYNQIAQSDAAAAPWALLQIGYTWEEAGKKEPAIKAFQQVCKRFPKTAQASTAHVRLQNVYKISVTLGGATDE